jgi:hypothetical protein
VKIQYVRFKYKGARDYIHGTDMFHAMTNVGESTAVRSNITFTIHKFVYTTMCRLYVASDKESLNEVANIAARCQLDIDGITHWMAIIPDDGECKEVERVTYDESQILSKCSLRKEKIFLNHLSPYNFIETVVAMNKHLHQSIFPNVEGKWIFTRINLPRLIENREGLALKLRHNMNYRLTKCDIEVCGDKVGDLFFSLV